MAESIRYSSHACMESEGSIESLTQFNRIISSQRKRDGKGTK